MEFGFFQGPKVTADFSGGDISSDSGLLLIKEFESKLVYFDRMARCIVDRRNPLYVTHHLPEQIAQRGFQIIAGYEDCNDADELRLDPTLRVVAGRSLEPHDFLSSQPTLCRFENSVTRHDIKRLMKLQVELFLESFGKSPEEIVLDIDATDDPVHGQQQLAMFHGYYEQYQFYPLIISSNRHILASILRPGTWTHTHGLMIPLRLIIEAIQKHFPETKVIVRADSGFSCPELHELLDKKGCGYYIGVAGNNRLKEQSVALEAQAEASHLETKTKQRLFTHTHYAAKSWAKERKVIIKAEYQEAGPNTRFVVTNDESRSDEDAYDFYAMRGSSEQWIGELKNGFKGDRLSCNRFVANQFRLLMYALAYQLMNLFQQSILVDTPLHVVSIDTLRKTIIKIGAQIKQSVRRIWFHLAGGYPYRDLFLTIHQKILAYA